MMSEVLSYLIMITCILIRVSSKEVKWTVCDPPPKLGQDLTLFCKVDNCTVRETKRWHGGPDNKLLMLNSGISTDKTKYSTSIEKNGFILTILDLTVKDLNISYTCSCGLVLDNHILYIEDVYTVDNLNKTINDTNYIRTNDVGGISLYVYIAIPVILVILLIIVIVKRRWLWGRLKEKIYGTGRRNTATESLEPSASWKDSDEVDIPNMTVPLLQATLLDSNPGQSSATESLGPSASWKDSDEVDIPNMTVPLLQATLLDSNPGQSSEEDRHPSQRSVDTYYSATESLEPSPSWKDSGNMNQVPPGSYSLPSSPSPKLVQDISRHQSEKTSLTNKPEIITSEMENHSSSSKGDNFNDTSALQQAIERLEDQIRKLKEEHEFYKSHQTDNTGPYHTDIEKQVEKLQSDNDKLQEEIDDLKRTSQRTSDLFRLSTQEQQPLQDDIVKLNSEKRILDENINKKNSELHKLQTQHTEEVSDLKNENQCLSQKVRDLQTENITMQAKCFEEVETKIKRVDVQIELEQLKSSYSSCQNDRDSLQTQLASAKLELEEYHNKLTESQTKHKLLQEQTTKAINDFNELVKKCHNEFKGNIRVFCRVRPKITEDGDGPMANNVVDYDRNNDGLIYVSNKTHKFEVDKVFKQGSLQKEVFDEVKALVTSCIDGYNVCIFSYGQTGCGKTFTMEGPPLDPGINPRALKELFYETYAKGDDWSFTITVSFIEIYNEIIRDLLSDNPSNKMEVKMNPDGGLYVPGLSLVVVKTLEDVNKVLNVGKQNRAIATTDMNEHSSRSHALLCVTVTGVNTTTNTKTTGKLNLVDLAGSERVSKSGAVGTRLKEAKNINKSLSSLGNVIHALRSKKNFVPYRDSKLTYLLQDSLGGDSKTLIIVQVAPVEKNVTETICSLNFAQRVRTVELGQASEKIKVWGCRDC